VGSELRAHGSVPDTVRTDSALSERAYLAVT
jgi:hypothetical protein